MRDKHYIGWLQNSIVQIQERISSGHYHFGDHKLLKDRLEELSKLKVKLK